MGRIQNGIMKLNSKFQEIILPISNKKVIIGRGLRLRRKVVLNCNGGGNLSLVKVLLLTIFLL